MTGLWRSFLDQFRGGGDAHSVSYLAFAGLYVALAQLLIMAIIARSLDLSGFGSFVLFLSFATTLDRLLNFQSWQAIIHFGQKGLYEARSLKVLNDLVRKCYLIDLTTACVSAVIAYVLAPVVSNFVGQGSELTETLRVASLLIVVNQVGVPMGVLRMLRKHSGVAIYRMLSATLTLVCVLVIAILGGELLDIQVGYVVSTAVAIIGLHLVGFRELEKISPPGPDDLASGSRTKGVNTRAVFSFLFYTNIESASKVLRELDVFIVARYTSEEVVGLYRVSRRLAESLHLVIDPFHQVLLPRFTKLALEKNLKEARKLALKSSQAALALSMFMLIAFVLVGEFLVTLLFGKLFAESYEIANLLMLGALLWALAVPLPSMNIALGNPRDNFWVHFLCALLSLGLTILLTAEIGVKGAVMGYLAFSLTWSVSILLVVRARIKQAYKLR